MKKGIMQKFCFQLFVFHQQAIRLLSVLPHQTGPDHPSTPAMFCYICSHQISWVPTIKHAERSCLASEKAIVCRGCCEHEKDTTDFACSVITVGQSCNDTPCTTVYMEVPLLGSCYIFVITWSWPALSIICLGGVTAGGAFRCPSTVVPAPSAIVRKYIPWRGAVCGFLVHPLLNYTQWS